MIAAKKEPAVFRLKDSYSMEELFGHGETNRLIIDTAMDRSQLDRRVKFFRVNATVRLLRMRPQGFSKRCNFAVVPIQNSQRCKVIAYEGWKTAKVCYTDVASMMSWIAIRRINR